MDLVKQKKVSLTSWHLVEKSCSNLSLAMLRCASFQ